MSEKRPQAGFSNSLERQLRSARDRLSSALPGGQPVVELRDRTAAGAHEQERQHSVHQCMTTRGVHKRNVSMITSRMTGTFRSDARTRAEFLRFIDITGAREL